MHIKTRFAPSPTGDIHLGNFRTALFNVLYARAQGGSFLLRIEDTDKARSKAEYISGLLHDLEWLGVTWEEGPVYQSARDAVYQTYYTRLEAEGWVYPCYCTEEALTLQRKIQLSTGQTPRYPGTCRNLSAAERQAKEQAGILPNLRFRVPDGQVVAFDDLVYGPKQFQTDDLGDFIIRKADGGPTFIFCNAVDDALMGVTHALRGEDHLTNTPRQRLVLDALGLTAPAYAHLPIILGTDGKPLSKRNGSQSIAVLRAQGYLPDTIINYIARLGHHYIEEGLMTMDALAKGFDLSRISTSPAHFDTQQIDHWQKLAVQAAEPSTLQAWLQPALASVPLESQAGFIALMQENIRFPAEAITWAMRYFGASLECEAAEQLLLQEAGRDFFVALLEVLSTVAFDAKEVTTALGQKTGKKGKALFTPLRCAITGIAHGAELFKVFALMGPDRVRARVQAVIDRLEN